MYKRKYPVDDKVIIQIEDKTFACSRAKLSEKSDYFYAMFNGEFTEKNKKNITIQDIPENGFLKCLNFFDGEKDLPADLLLDMLHCASVLQFLDIKSYCIDRLSDHLPIEMCFEIWSLAESLDIHPLSEMAKCIALLNFSRLKKMQCFFQLDLKQLHSYLANHLICCDNELDIFQVGMNWWYTNSEKFKETENWSSEDTTNYLYVILSCVDIKTLTKSDINHMLAFPDIKDSKEISSILMEIHKLIDSPQIKMNDIGMKARKLYYDTETRNRNILPCIVTSEYPWLPESSNKGPMERKVNISYYDLATKSMKPLETENNNFASKCVPSLNGCKVLSYRENIILFGGEYRYGSANWNKNIWMYHAFKSKWELLTKFPMERRHFIACIVDDKLFIIGGTGKYRIKFNSEMMMYDFITDKWVECIRVPYSCHDIRFCEYQNKLLVIPTNGANSCGYIFNLQTLGWLKLDIEFPSNFKFDFTKNIVLFAKGKSIYMTGTHFIEMKIVGAILKVVNFQIIQEFHGDKISYIFISNDLYIFSKHDTTVSGEQIFQLHRFNLNSKQTELLIQINDSVDQWWHLRRGCFPYFHYNITKNVQCISKFTI